MFISVNSVLLTSLVFSVGQTRLSERGIRLTDYMMKELFTGIHG